MSRMTVFGRPDPMLGWDGAHVYDEDAEAAGTPPPAALEGAVAGVQNLGAGAVRAFRDRLGLGKLFWAPDRDGGLGFAWRPIDLVRAGYAFADIAAVPRGRVFELGADGEVLADGTIARAGPTPPVEASTDEIGETIRTGLEAYLAAVAAAYPARRAYLCLSGGLDSSTIAVLARRYFSDLRAVSFDLVGRRAGASEDRAAAERLAADLGIDMLEASVSEDRLFGNLDRALVAGIDWRDFNVHCALVNAALAETIAEDAGAGEDAPLVITGDLPNELLVDYEAETYKGATYYALPRIAPTALRRALVDGLDTCHREVGVFGAYGLKTVQPYAACVDAYLGLPGDFLERRDRKERLAEAIVGGDLPDYIYRRTKVRAQIGDPESGGTLGACIERGIDARWLRRRFASLHGLCDDDDELDRFIRAGRYRAARPALAEETHGYA